MRIWLVGILLLLPFSVLGASVTDQNNDFSLTLDVSKVEVAPGESISTKITWTKNSASVFSPCLSLLVREHGPHTSNEFVEIDLPKGIQQGDSGSIQAQMRLYGAGDHAIQVFLAYYTPPPVQPGTLSGQPPCPSAADLGGGPRSIRRGRPLTVPQNTASQAAHQSVQNYTLVQLHASITAVVENTITGFDTACMANELGESWETKEDHFAAEYIRSNHDYRTWKPRWLVLADGGLHVYWKVEHKRTWATDDRAAIDIKWDKFGVMQSVQVAVSIAKESEFTESVDYAAGLAASTGEPYAVGAAMIAQASSRIYDAIVAMNEKGGRLVFRSVIEENMEIANKCFLWETP
ncbi:MAG: hypothetical protein OES10_14175 [Gammaproteobacteria bacterium]|nr:hypothetical protein [Gammaproteobacteria bacterium]